MPEGDVLLRVTRRLHAALAGTELIRSELRWGDLGGTDLTGQRVVECVSYGKNSLLRLSSGITLQAHLKMDGTWWVDGTSVPPRPYRDSRIRVVLANERWTCVSRLTGQLRLVPTGDEPRLLAGLGPDLLAGSPGAAEAAAPNFVDIARRAHSRAEAPIGAVLLDQRIAAGIGTIYLAETLWVTGVHPLTPVRALPQDVVERIYRTATALMVRSADAAELTATGQLRPGWRTHVHGREHLPCRRCGHPLARLALAPWPGSELTRPAFFCPQCQPTPPT